MQDVPGAVSPQLDKDDIKTKGAACRDPVPDQGGCHECDMVLLSGVDSTGSLQQRFAGLHFNHDHDATIGRLRDQVDLTSTKSQISSEYPVPPASQPFRSLAFSRLTEAEATPPSPDQRRAWKRESAIATTFISMSWRSS